MRHKIEVVTLETIKAGTIKSYPQHVKRLEILDAHPFVTTFKYRPFRIQLGSKKRYVPPFLVTYENNSEVIEDYVFKEDLRDWALEMDLQYDVIANIRKVRPGSPRVPCPFRKGSAVGEAFLFIATNGGPRDLQEVRDYIVDLNCNPNYVIPTLRLQENRKYTWTWEEHFGQVSISNLRLKTAHNHSRRS